MKEAGHNIPKVVHYVLLVPINSLSTRTWPLIHQKIVLNHFLTTHLIGELLSPCIHPSLGSVVQQCDAEMCATLKLRSRVMNNVSELNNHFSIRFFDGKFRELHWFLFQGLSLASNKGRRDISFNNQRPKKEKEIRPIPTLRRTRQIPWTLHLITLRLKHTLQEVPAR